MVRSAVILFFYSFAFRVHILIVIVPVVHYVFTIIFYSSLLKRSIWITNCRTINRQWQGGCEGTEKSSSLQTPWSVTDLWWHYKYIPDNCVIFQHLLCFLDIILLFQTYH